MCLCELELHNTVPLIGRDTVDLATVRAAAAESFQAQGLTDKEMEEGLVLVDSVAASDLLKSMVNMPCTESTVTAAVSAGNAIVMALEQAGTITPDTWRLEATMGRNEVSIRPVLLRLARIEMMVTVQQPGSE
jgi:hypothetical protein